MADRIEALDDPEFGSLCDRLAARADELDREGVWPSQEWAWLAECGAPRWFFPAEFGGLDWNETDQLSAYVRLSAASMTVAFVLTQWHAAVRRILASENRSLAERVVPSLILGEQFTTVGISHLTTSRRHLARPAMTARETPTGFVLDGYSPWVTGAGRAAWIVTGAVLDEGPQVLVALPTSSRGVAIESPERLTALSASETGRVTCENILVNRDWFLAGPAESVLNLGGSSTGGLQTSALAIGLATAATARLTDEARRRADLSLAAAELDRERATLQAELLASTTDSAEITGEQLRARANSLALRSTQAYLAAAKGTGYLAGHPAGRWCREALFFLVWSCPQPVINANLCELAGLG